VEKKGIVVVVFQRALTTKIIKGTSIQKYCLKHLFKGVCLGTVIFSGLKKGADRLGDGLHFGHTQYRSFRNLKLSVSRIAELFTRKPPHVSFNATKHACILSYDTLGVCFVFNLFSMC